jgi:hypothetical protein
MRTSATGRRRRRACASHRDLNYPNGSCARRLNSPPDDGESGERWIGFCKNS